MSIAMPTVKVEIRFAAGAVSVGFPLGDAILGLSTLGEAVAYTDVSTDVRAVTISRGKQRELDEFAAGMCSVVLDNRDRDYDPLYTSSPYFVDGETQVKTGRWMRVKATHPTTGVEYDLYKGTIRNWDLNYDFPNDATSTPSATDYIENLTNTNITTTTSAGLSGVMVGEILNEANILERTLDTGNTSLQAVTFAGANALTALQTATKSEGGGTAAIYCDGTGDVVFEDRLSLTTNARSSTSQATFGDAALPVDSVELSYDSDLIKNDISLTRIGGTVQTKTSSTSKDDYGIRSFSLTGLYNNDDTSVENIAQLYLDAFSEAELRIRKITINPRMNAALMTQALSRKIRDIITITYDPPNTAGGTNTVTKQMFISGIDHDFSAEIMRTTFTLESTTGRSPYWTLGASELGIGTKLSF